MSSSGSGKLCIFQKIKINDTNCSLNLFILFVSTHSGINHTKHPLKSNETALFKTVEAAALYL